MINLLLLLLLTFGNSCVIYNDIEICDRDDPKVTHINESCYTYDDYIICIEDLPCEFCDKRIELTEEEQKLFEETFGKD